MKQSGSLPDLVIAHKLAALLFVFLLCQASSAQEADVEEWATLTEVTIDQEPLPMEELTVVAPQSLASMRNELIRVEDDVLAVYNNLNDDNDFDIYCRKETPTMSYIAIRVCRANFVDRLTAEAASNFIGSSAYDDPTGELRYYESLLREKMATLMEENPALYQVLLSYYELKTDYEAERAERSEDNFFAR